MQSLRAWAGRDGAEAKRLISLGFPVFAALASNRGLSTISLSFVGKIGSSELAAAGLATSLANVTGDSVLVGISSAMQTLCGQAFGAKALKEVGNWWQRAVLILWMTCIPISLLWWFMEPLLLLIGQEPDVAHMTNMFLRCRIPGIFAYALFQGTQAYLQSQGIVYPSMISSIAVCLIHPLYTWGLTYHTSLSYTGAAFAYSISNTLQAALLLIIVYVAGYQRSTFDGVSGEAFKGWWTFFKLGLPSLLMLGEWWASEIVTIAAGKLPQPQESLAAMSIFQQTNALSFMLPLGLSIAVGIRVANELGAGQAARAKHAALVAMEMSFVLAATLGSTIFLARGQVGRVFTGDSELLKVTARVMILMAGYIGCDGLQTVLGGILRGTGRQATAVPVIFFSYFVLALPASYLFAFVLHWGVIGLSAGMFLGTICNSIIYAILCIRTDWQKGVEEALERTGKSKEEQKALLDSNDEENAHSEDA
ncbi:hypothetical protein WJX84_004748 [Apatococcus fuscideae]|uniref:Protein DETOXIFICATION n=1 Tax=Apatococcus fuscideae TaxID=2026836 RepID=A0AAW1TKG8_9CHLO